MPTSTRRALLRRIEDELLLAAAIPELAWPRGVVALEGAPPAAIAEQLRPARLDDVADRRLHALAALESARLARALEGTDERALEEAARACVRTWAALGQRGTYLASLAHDVVGRTAVPAPEIAARIGIEQVRAALLSRARAGLELGALLRAVREASAAPGEVGRLASRAALEAIDLVLEPLRRTLDELATRRPTIDEVVAAFAALRAAWRRCDRDVELEVLAVERLADFAWDLYRDRSLTELARVLDEVTEPSSSLATRIERGDPAMAWAAPCAQVLVFRSELAGRFDAQVALAERAYAVCPTLRNARLVLGDFLLTRAERALDRNVARTSGGTTPEEDVERAARLHPELKRLPAVRAKLGEKKPS